MLRFHDTNNLKIDSLSLVDNFQYHPKGSKNLLPHQTGLQDIFNIMLSIFLDTVGLKQNLGFYLRESIAKDGSPSFMYEVSGSDDFIQGSWFGNEYRLGFLVNCTPDGINTESFRIIGIPPYLGMEVCINCFKSEEGLFIEDTSCIQLVFRSDLLSPKLNRWKHNKLKHAGLSLHSK